MEAPDKHNEYMDFEEAARMMVQSEIVNIISWNDYLVTGDIEEIKKIVRSHGIINIGVDDIISTLSTTNTNYVTSGIGIGPDRILTALNHAIDQLPVELQDIQKMIVNVWTSEFKPVVMSEIKAMVKRLGYTLPVINLIWGVAVDPDMKEDIKITLIAVNKHKLC